MKLINKKKNKIINDPINMINECISGINEVKEKIYKNRYELKKEYYTTDELDEYVNWGLNFKVNDFVR